MPEQGWNVNDIVHENDFDKIFRRVELDLPKFKKFFDKMHPNMSKQKFNEVVDFNEKISERIHILYSRYALLEEVNRKDQVAKKQVERVQELSIRAEDASRKITLWIRGKKIDGKNILDDKNATRLFLSVPGLEYALKRSRDAAKYTLSEMEERIITKKDSTGLSPLLDLRALIETDLVFPVKVGNKPTKIYRTVDEVTKHFTSSKPMIRKAAYVSLLSTYKKNIEKFFLIYQAVVKNWNNEADIRGYKSPISIRNFANNIPDEVTSKLIDVCVKNKNLFHHYFEFKAKELRVKKLKRFDIYAPIPKHEERSYSYNQSVDIILSVLGDFCNTFKIYAERIINERHIDVYPRPNKASGAFCSSVTPNITPYVLLNFTGRKRDVMTMAHELGHGIHGIYSNKNRLGAYHANLPLSETASTFSEMLVFEDLIKNAKTVQERKALLFEKMADSYATILRQCYFVKFELIAHRSIKDGITPEELSDSYFNLLKEQFGDVVDIDPLFRYEWAYIPHIVVNPFYCYAYNFGELLSLALFARYKKEGSNFIYKIEKILSYGGSKDPQEVLREAGVDITSRSFWQSSFDILDSWQTQLDGG